LFSGYVLGERVENIKKGNPDAIARGAIRQKVWISKYRMFRKRRTVDEQIGRD
jgi:hypothetical protein